MSGGHRVFVIDAERNETESIEEEVARATVNDGIEAHPRAKAFFRGQNQVLKLFYWRAICCFL